MYIRRHIPVISLVLGNFIIATWTLLCFFTKPINFDLTGQQVLLSQWLHGYMDGSVTAPTNYIAKMLIYAPFYYAPWPAHVSIILMTLLINVISFTLIFFILKRLMIEVGIRVSGYFYVGMLWLAVIAGSVFWIEYANSRNLEVAGGLFLILSTIRLMKRSTVKAATGLALFSGVLFFTDPLQLYMTAVIAVMYAGYMAYKKRLWRRLGLLLIALVAGYALSVLIRYGIHYVTNVEFFSVNSFQQSVAIFHDPIRTGYTTLKANLLLLSGAHDIGRLSQFANLALIGVSVALFLLLTLKKRLPANTAFFIFGGVAVVEGVYVASGQPAFGGDTSRYLVMIAPLFVLVVASMTYLGKKSSQLYGLIASIVIITNCLLLLGATLTHWTMQLPADARLSEAADYVDQRNTTYAYASMDTAIPATYLYRPQGILLPLSCDDQGLRRTYLFYDKGLFRRADQSVVAEVPIILDGELISNSPNICNVAKIVSQLGAPIRQEKAGGSTVLIYSPETLRLRLH